jgi:ribosomal-protein-alanine N-acetyltransferase
MVFLASERVELVPLDPEDQSHVEAYRQSRNDPAMRATGAYGRGLTAGLASDRITDLQSAEEESALCAIRIDEGVVGWGTVHTVDTRSRTARVGYYVLPEQQGNGYASEAARLLVEYAFDELNMHRVEATVQGDNPASKRVLEKLGFVHEGTKRDAFYKDGEYRDLTLWAALAEEFVRE